MCEYFLARWATISFQWKSLLNGVTSFFKVGGWFNVYLKSHILSGTAVHISESKIPSTQFR
jgi:hypothetical protein